MTLLFYDRHFTEHHTTPGHVECPERVEEAYRRLEETGVAKQCGVGECQPIRLDQVRALHSAEMIERAQSVCLRGGGSLDADTPVSEESYSVALLAAGTACAAVDAVLAGKAKNAFCLIRPPGHHATPKRSMGFCLFNSIALAAHHALSRHGLARLLIVDWDVHHGNGTQDVFYDVANVMFFSSHRYPFYPGTGRESETGTGAGLGYTLNLPVSYGTPVSQFRRDFAARLETAANKIRPELVLLSAGFDAHRKDPIGDLGLDFEDFLWLAESVGEVARTECGGRLVSLLEGGYNRQVLAQCVVDHVRYLLAQGHGPREASRGAEP